MSLLGDKAQFDEVFNDPPKRAWISPECLGSICSQNCTGHSDVSENDISGSTRFHEVGAGGIDKGTINQADLFCIGSHLDGQNTSQDQQQLRYPRKLWIFSKVKGEPSIVLEKWLQTHLHNPFPNIEELQKISAETCLTHFQTQAWFACTRNSKSHRKQQINISKDKLRIIEQNFENLQSEKVEKNLEHSNFPKLQKKLQPKIMHGQYRGEEKSLEPAQLPTCNGDWVDKWLEIVVEDTICKMQLSSPHEGQRRDHCEAQSSAVHFKARRSNTFITSITGGSAHPSGDFGGGLGGRGSESCASSFGSSRSHASIASHASWAGRQGRKKLPPNDFSKVFSAETKARKYECTWCWEPFKTKYDWRRHEESQHAPQIEWVCVLDGLDGLCKIQESGALNQSCVYCGYDRPNESHYSMHGFSSCLKKPVRERSFDRKDHLIQHLRCTHNCEAYQASRIARNSSQPLQAPDACIWECPFCVCGVMTWKDRTFHVSKHFEEGICSNLFLRRVCDYFRCAAPSDFYMHSSCFDNFTYRKDAMSHVKSKHPNFIVAVAKNFASSQNYPPPSYLKPGI